MKEEILNNYCGIPEKREERVKKLEEAVSILKSEFIGLDDIIDDIKKSITPWYITPEVVKRPVVISLWGMTGTGKTSLVKKLTGLLGLSGKTIFFDCGQESNNPTNISEQINDNYSNNNYGIDSIDGQKESDTRDLVFIFDEFQHARTINEFGREDIKPSLRPIWNIIDDGKLSVNSYRYGIISLCGYINDLDSFTKQNQNNYNIKVINGEVKDLNGIKALSEDLGCVYEFGEDYEKLGKIGKSNSDYESTSTEPEPIKLLNYGKAKYTLISKLNGIKEGFGTSVYKEISSKEILLGDLVAELKKYLNMIIAPKILNCDKSLVFIIGNLDEAFLVEGEINPDYDADMFNEITSKVTISDIKEALKKRFRAEQIARFGNNIIKYPTLKREHFMRIIEKELNNIFTEFKKSENIDITYGTDILDLVYSESVYPVQGVRPVFSTIELMITPLLSDIILEKKDSTSVNMKVKNKINEFKVPEITLIFEYNNGYISEKIIKLQLGRLRDPRDKKTRYINSVHEAGHAIVYSYLKGIAPTNIVGISSNRGGFCTTFDTDSKEIDSRRDVKNEVMISLAGYEAEKLIYKGYEDDCLLGSGSDLKKAWDILSYGVYKLGYYTPIIYSNRSIEFGGSIPSGISDNSDLEGLNIESRIKKEYSSLREETIKILKNEEKLLKKLALYIGDNGSMDSKKFMEFVESFGNKLTVNFMKEKSKESNIYYNKLLED